MRDRILTAATASALGLVVTAGAAQAAVPGAMRAIETHHNQAAITVAAHRRAATFICLANSPTKLCWHMNGSGAQPTLASLSTNWSAMSEVNVRRDGNGNLEWQEQSGAGKCIYANVDSRVLEANGACDSGRTNEYWNGGLNSGNIESEAFPGQAILVYNDLAGKPLWQDIFSPGTWRKWVTG
jgi:hypothetical protein